MITAVEGHVHTELHVDPCWLFVWETTELETGRTWLSVYRSIRITDESPLYDPAELHICEDMWLQGLETIEDINMMGGSAELLIYSR